MSQQINLLNPSLIKQKDFLNLNNIGIMLGMLSVLMLAYYSYAQKQLSLLSAQRQQIALDLSATQSQLKQTALLHAPREQNKALLDQILHLDQKEKMQQQILETVSQSSATPENGYAALMRAFAKQSVEGLWLTSFNIDSQTDKLNISGKTLQADLVPEYIARLSHEPALQGKLFSALNMNLPKVDTLATNHASDSPVTNSAAVAGKTSALANIASQSSASQVSEANYIEFSLQSVDEKSAPNSESTLHTPASGEKS